MGLGGWEVGGKEEGQACDPTVLRCWEVLEKGRKKAATKISPFLTSVRGSEPHLLGAGDQQGPRPPCPGPAGSHCRRSGKGGTLGLLDSIQIRSQILCTVCSKTPQDI